MKKLARILSYILVAMLASMLTMALMVFAPAGSPLFGRGTSKLEQLKDLLTQCYIGGADETVLEDAAAAAMVQATGDRWSYYIPADQYDAYLERMNNAYVGIGITIQLTEDGSGFVVTKVEENGPAREAGVRAGDVIEAISGKSTTGMNTDEAGELVRGEEGTQVRLTLLRDQQTLELAVTRRTIQTVVARGQMLDGNIGLVTIANFDQRCAQETAQAIDSLLEQGAGALIFDVRNNPGGYANQLVQVLDKLLPEGELFRTVDYRGQVSVDRSDAACLDIPMAVLVNGESYSAAEFFAAALKDYDAALVVGEKTCGKGYFQVNYRLSDGSAVNISIGEYFTPKGQNLAGIGITPDVEVPVDEQTFLAIYSGSLTPEEDPQIQAAVAALQK